MVGLRVGNAEGREVVGTGDGARVGGIDGFAVGRNVGTTPAGEGSNVGPCTDPLRA